MKIFTYSNSQLSTANTNSMAMISASNFNEPWTFVITAAWDGKAIENQSMDYILTMTEDPCSPGPTTIAEDAKNQVHSFDFFLRGSMATTYDWKPLVFDPKNLCPQFEYEWILNSAATNGIDPKTVVASASEFVFTYGKLTVQPNKLPLSYNGGQYVFIGVPKGQDGNFMPAMSGYMISVTVNLIDPCSVAKDPNNKDPKEVYIIGSGPKDFV